MYYEMELEKEKDWSDAAVIAELVGSVHFLPRIRH